MTDIIGSENLQGTFSYFDKPCGKTQEEHEKYLKHHQDVASQRQITYNDSKSVFSTRRLAILGYIVRKKRSSQTPNFDNPFFSSRPQMM